MEIATVAVGFEQAASCRETRDGRNRLERVFDACGDALYRFISVRVGGDRAAADDLLQQTCYVAVRRPRRIPPDDGACEAWLRGIARNLIRQHWRRSKRRRGQVHLEDAEVSRKLAEDMESRPLPDESLIKAEFIEQLLLAVTSLPADAQRLVFAFYFEGRSYAGIAEEFGMTAKGVETRLYRARGRLRAILRDIEREGSL